MKTHWINGPFCDPDDWAALIEVARFVVGTII
jgi:hypothetical protein